MRKTLALLMVAVLAVFLVACGESPSPAPGGNDPGDNQPEKVTIEEQVLLDRDGILIKATGLEESWFGPEVKVYIENNSTQSITVQVRNTSVNGYMVDPTFSCDVMPDKKATDEISFSSSTLSQRNIDVITEIEFNFHIFDADSWDKIFDSETIVIQTSAVGTYTQVYDSSGDVIFDSSGIKIVYQGLSQDWLGTSADLYIENNTNQAITLQARSTSVNGFMIDPIFSCEIMPGKKALDGLTFISDYLDANGIELITEIELKFHIFNSSSWNTILDTNVITIDTN